MDPLRIGISACLLGQPVRFDGGHKRDAFITDILGPFVEWVSVCPEVEAGFGTPRETMRLVNTDGTIRLITRTGGEDLTARMERFSRARAKALVKEDLHGYILKKDSPSCGMERVKVYDRHSTPARTGQGLFAAALRERFPHLPIEEEGRLSDPRLRENFIERIFAYQRLRALFSGRWTVGSLVAFHTAHKLTLMAHSVTAYRELGRLVAGAKTRARDEVAAEYQHGFMEALGTLATTRKHTNALQHMAGYFKYSMDAASKTELQDAIKDYRTGLVPLIVPITLIRHHVRAHNVTYLAGQTYLEPHPKELMLRNHV